ncbi:MAG: C40 family peptidase, partial [Lachnospiraceae bacterium]|nr:C40 family peptidase [Lachnospiraceae bacterium]
IKRKNKYYYVSTKYLSSKRKNSSSSSSTEVGKCIVNYAKKFIGNPYRSGGTSLTKGADCSGFTKAIYAHFGFSLPRTSAAQRHAGRQVSWSQKKPGDLICYSVHVAIYMGNNRIIHASTPKSGIKTSKYITFSKVLSVRRILPS